MLCYRQPNTVEDMIAVSFDKNLYTCSSKSRKNVAHGRLALRVKVGFRAVHNYNLLLLCQEQSYDEWEGISEAVTDICRTPVYFGSMSF